MEQQELVLQEQLGREQTDTLQMEMLRLLTADQDVVINAQQVSDCETSCLQLLTAFVNDAKAGQLKIIWQNPSRVLHENAERLSLNGILNIPADKVVEPSEISAEGGRDEVVILEENCRKPESEPGAEPMADDEVIILSPKKKAEDNSGDGLCPVF